MYNFKKYPLNVLNHKIYIYKHKIDTYRIIKVICARLIANDRTYEKDSVYAYINIMCILFYKPIYVYTNFDRVSF